MAFSSSKILITVVQLLLMTLFIFVASPESGVACRPLLLHGQWVIREPGLLWQSLPNAPAPPSGGDPIHS
ncbi:hypothetical protein Fmac_029990 [Flemingia macrophylla]|uniref:Uncharacterized protein n=1 Tax=Flemingia macrophylla TaxID=520843 RepID=A0ABD1LC22_9FABA